ncbi:MAG: hypothetical protein Q7S33_00035 [Nanoarchaeota archaeon]|nr:hypothetical protein [Nanoarchaeota archaeon]
MNKIIIPNTIFGVNTKEAYNKIMSEDYTKPVATPIINPIQMKHLDNPESWIMLEGKTHENYSYPDMLIDSARIVYTSNNSEFLTASQKLGITLQNTSKDFLGRDFIGKIDWGQAMKLNLLLGNKNIPQRMFVDFLSLLYEGISGKKVYNASGKILDSKFCEQIYEDIIKVQSPLRAEYLDADFKYENNKLYIEYEHKLDSNGNLIAGKREELSDWLDKDKNPGIDLISLFKTANKHGLSTSKTKSGDLYYHCPDKDNNSVSRFGAGSGRAGLNCVWVRSGTGSGLGVRACTEGAAAKNLGGKK